MDSGNVPAGNFYKQKMKFAKYVDDLIKEAGEQGIKVAQINYMVTIKYGFGESAVKKFLDSLLKLDMIEIRDEVAFYKSLRSLR